MTAAPAADRTREVWTARDYQRAGVRRALAAARRDGNVVCADVVPALEADFADPWGSSTRGGGPGIVGTEHLPADHGRAGRVRARPGMGGRT
jgi:hypothetical protein